MRRVERNVVLSAPGCPVLQTAGDLMERDGVSVMYRGEQQTRQYEDFQATALYCPRCKQAMPVRSRLLLVLPDGELHEYLCQACSSSLGTKKMKQQVSPVAFV